MCMMFYREQNICRVEDASTVAHSPGLNHLKRRVGGVLDKPAVGRKGKLEEEEGLSGKTRRAILATLNFRQLCIAQHTNKDKVYREEQIQEGPQLVGGERGAAAPLEMLTVQLHRKC